jgi:hypothetical protein
VNFLNKTNEMIYLATAPNASAPGQFYQLFDNGGVMLGGGSESPICIPANWGGRFWARTGCSDTTKSCATGDCGANTSGTGEWYWCQGRTGKNPQTLVEFTFDGNGNTPDLDVYDVSLVNGYNISATIEPLFTPASAPPGFNPNYWCTIAGCNNPKSTVNLLKNCPTALQVKNASGDVIACDSACDVFNQDMYCCTGEYGCSPAASTCPSGTQPCDPTKWPQNYAAVFKAACPGAYSFPFDDPTSTFQCSPSDTSVTRKYLVTFFYP